jgi:hypothetical protein
MDPALTDTVPAVRDTQNPPGIALRNDSNTSQLARASFRPPRSPGPPFWLLRVRLHEPDHWAAVRSLLLVYDPKAKGLVQRQVRLVSGLKECRETVGPCEVQPMLDQDPSEPPSLRLGPHGDDVEKPVGFFWQV